MNNQLSKMLLVVVLFLSLTNCNATNKSTNESSSKKSAGEILNTTETAADISKFTIERESRLNFTETVDSLSLALKTNGWKISAIHDIENDLKKSGQDILPVKVLEICNPKHSGKMLLVDDMRYLSIIMPCRVSIYEKSNGKTYITLMNSIEMAKMIGGPIVDQIKAIQEEIDNKILPFLK
jgi:uncharacterized protein (DUF302 family)